MPGIIGSLIRKERHERGMRLVDLAERIRVSDSALARFETTERGLSAQKVKEILKEFGLNDKSIYYIFVVNDIVKHSKEFGFSMDETFEFMCRADIDQLQVTKEELKKLIH
jgi:transcriptional regulator with XRE-family HTH domain